MWAIENGQKRLGWTGLSPNSACQGPALPVLEPDLLGSHCTRRPTALLCRNPYTEPISTVLGPGGPRQEGRAKFSFGGGAGWEG